MAKMQISESELNRIISKSINKALNEGFGRAMAGATRNLGGNFRNAAAGGVNNQNGMQRNNAQAQQPQAQQPQWTSTIAEGSEDEGLFDRLGSAFRGAKQGYQAQKSLDRGTDDFKQQHDFDDVRKSMDNPLSKMDNTAEEQATHLYNQYKQYQQQANKMLNMYNAICKKYGLQKKAVGQHVTTEPSPTGTGVNFSTPNAKNKFGRKTNSRDTSHLKNSWFEEEE